MEVLFISLLCIMAGLGVLGLFLGFVAIVVAGNTLKDIEEY